MHWQLHLQFQIFRFIYKSVSFQLIHLYTNEIQLPQTFLTPWHDPLDILKELQLDHANWSATTQTHDIDNMWRLRLFQCPWWKTNGFNEFFKHLTGYIYKINDNQKLSIEIGWVHKVNFQQEKGTKIPKT